MSPAAPRIPLDRASPVPLYFQVAQHLEQAIESGDLPAGSRLENEIALADQLGLSRPTMRRAIQHLVDRGLVVRKRGVGTQVVHTKVRRPLELTSLYDDLAKTGRKPSTEVLSFEVEAATGPVAHALGLAEGADVYAIERLRHADDEPLALLHNYLPVQLLALTREDLAEYGLYDILRRAGITLKMASQTIGARSARSAEARALDEPRGAPLLTMSRTVYDDHGRAVEYGDHVYRASLYSFELTLTGL
ncbi:MAG: UTRA domain-containing protein [Micromonosporaceae bacterium]|nr:UTRA domain-containing protein [Micromonosporaceae bacterium]